MRISFEPAPTLLVMALSLAGLLFASCGGSNGSSNDGGGGMTGSMGNLFLTDTHNYTADTTLNIPTIQTAAGADLMVCWDSVMKDIQCHDLVSPDRDIDNVGFLKIPNMSKMAVQDKLEVGTLNEMLVQIYREYHTDQNTSSKCANLSQFVLGSQMLSPANDYVADTTKVYMLLFATGTTPGVGSRTMVFIEPTASSTNTMVQAPDGCAANILDFNATLGQPLAVDAADNTKWDLDWNQITHDVFGNPVPTRIDRVLVGFYQGRTAADLQANFLDIEVTATALYEVAVPAGQKHVNLAGATLRGAGTAFPGFMQTDGVWAVAVMCSKCQVPAPIVMTTLQLQ